MASLRRCEVWSSYECDSGTRQAILALQDCASLSSTERVTREDTLTLTIPKASSAADAFVLGRVLRLAYNDESYDEWRIHEMQDQSGRDGGRIRVVCRSVLFELRDLALIASTTNGVLSTAATWAAQTPTTIVDDLLVSLPAWWARGTIDPTTAVSVDVAQATPLLVLRALVAALNAAGDTCEVDVRRNGSTGYYIDLVTAIGASATSADIRTGKNILTSERLRSREPLVTRVYPRGASDTSIEFAYWRVAAVSGSDVEIRQAETSASAIGFDGQLDGLYLENDAGTRTLITDSVAATSTVTVASATGYAVGEWCRITADASGGGVYYLEYPAAASQKVGIVEDTAGAATNLVDNPFLSRWPGSTSAPPTGWSAGGGTTTQNTDLAYIRRGTYSLRMQTTSNSHTLASSVQNVLAGRGTTYSAKVDVYKNGSATLIIRLCNQSGGVLSSVSDSGAAGWISAEFTAINIGVATGLFVQMVPPNTALDWYLDSAQITVGATQEAWTSGSGPATVYRRALVHLVANATDPTSYTISVADLARWASDEWPYDSLTLGATLTITDTDLGITTTSRIQEIQRDYLNPLQTTLILERQTRTLTTTLAAA